MAKKSKNLALHFLIAGILGTIAIGYISYLIFDPQVLKVAEVTDSIVTTSPTSTDSANTDDLALPIPDPSTSASSSASPNISPDPSLESEITPTPSPSISPSPSPTITKPSSPVNLRYNCYGSSDRITLRWDEVVGATSYSVSFDQTDGDHDQTKSSIRPEVDLDIKSNTNYTWRVVSFKNDLASDPTTVADIKCSGETTASQLSSPTPSPSIISSPTPAPTKKSLSQTISNVIKPKSPSPSPTVSPTSPRPSPGSLADIFVSKTDPQEEITNQDSVSLVSKILLGWQALFYKFVEVITR